MIESDESDQYTLEETAEGLGMRVSDVKQLVFTGRLSVTHDKQHTTANKLRRFVRDYPNKVDVHKADWLWLIGVLIGFPSRESRIRYVDNRPYQTPRKKATWRKLTDEQIREIRTIYATEPVSMPDLARMYGVSSTAVWKVVNFQTYKHIHE